MLLFFSVARSQENGSWERATEVAPGNTTAGNTDKPAKPAKPAGKTSAAGGNPAFGTNMPMMSSAFDTSMWLNAA